VLYAVAPGHEGNGTTLVDVARRFG
jgi:hypothetical protein